jgi:hypothetical protein
VARSKPKSDQSSSSSNDGDRVVASVTIAGSTDANDLWYHHQQVRTYYSDLNTKKREAFDFLRGVQWNDEELNRFRQLNKAPVVLNGLKTSERTVIGLFLQNRYDVKFSPFEPNDQNISDILNSIYIHTENSQNWAFKDIEVIRQAWACGLAYQEVYMDVEPGREPRMCTNVLNPFAVYFDPESRDLITREDALFVDRETWVTPEYLSDKFDIPLNELEALIDDTVRKDGEVYRDLSHETLDRRNGRIRIVERFYKSYRKILYIIDAEMNRIEVPPEAREQLKSLGQEVYRDREETLNLAIMCPAYNTGKYLFNDEYHNQPRDVSSQKIIWPILEMVAESLNGDPSGFVLPQAGANKVTNSVMSTIVHAAKHAASTAYLRKKGAFDDETAKLFDANHTNADEVFPVNEEVPLSEAVLPIPKGEGASRDNYQALEIAMGFQEQVSSTPPAIKGMTENASTSGILNAQRIEQAFVQLQVLIANWKHFMRRRAQLCQYYWRTYWTYEKTIRIIGQDGQQDFLTINSQEPELDAMGNQTGAIVKANDVSTAEYDAVIEDSYRSATYREKTQQQIAQLISMPGINADPVLAGMLTLEFARVSDLSQDLKDFLKKHSSVMAQKVAQEQAQAAQSGQIQNAQGMQQLAQAEAEQTAPEGASAGSVPFPQGPEATSGYAGRQFEFMPPQAAAA